MEGNRLKKIFTMFLGTGLNAVLGIITIPIITHIIPPEEYGSYSILHTYISILVTVCLLGLEQAYVRFYYQMEGEDYRRSLTKKVVSIPLINALLIMLVVIFWGKNFISVTGFSYVLLALCILVTVVDTFTRLSVRLEQDTFLYSILLIVHRIIYAVVAIGFVLVLRVSSVDSLLYANILSLGAIAFVAVLSKRGIWLKKSEQKNHGIVFKDLLRYSSPFIFSSIANWVFNATDKLALQHYSTYTEVGYYAAASNIVVIITIIQTTFSTVWVPMAVENFEKKPNNKEFYIKSNDIVTLIMVLAGAAIVLFKDIFGWILGGDYTLAVYIFPCLVLHPIMFTVSETTVYGINFYKKTYWHVVITVCSCGVNIIGNMLLVPELGGKGAAISTGLSYILFFVLRTVISNRYFKVKFHYRKIFMAVSLLVVFLLFSTFNKTNLISIIMFLIIGIVVSIIYKDTIKYIAVLLKNVLIDKKWR